MEQHHEEKLHRFDRFLNIFEIQSTNISQGAKFLKLTWHNCQGLTSEIVRTTLP